MYVTRPLSLYRRDPSALSLPPPEGPNSGVLVIQDEEAQPTCCFGLCYSSNVKKLPFPQNYNLQVQYTQSDGQSSSTDINHVALIPVLNQPLSSNQYYCIERKGKHKGEAYRNSKEEDKTTCCFCRCITDFKPDPLEPQAYDMYQKFEIRSRDWGGFVAKSIASDGYPPSFLRRKGWTVHTTSLLEFGLNEAQGLDKTLRARLPDFSSFSLSQRSSAPVLVGKWYCPFMFIKDGSVKDQMDSSRYYEITLHQHWEQIFACENEGNANASVTMDVDTKTEAIKIAGENALQNEKRLVDGVMWFGNVGLSLLLVERMKWEQERFGWISGSEGQVKVKRTEEFGGIGEWKKFGCYVLVERFVLKRMNGSLVMTYDFRHTQHVISKWE